MAALVFVLRCPKCRAVFSVYDTVQSSPSDLGYAVAYAAQHGGAIAFEPSPVELTGCNCENDEKAT